MTQPKEKRRADPGIPNLVEQGYPDNPARPVSPGMSPVPLCPGPKSQSSHVIMIVSIDHLILFFYHRVEANPSVLPLEQRGIPLGKRQRLVLLN